MARYIENWGGKSSEMLCHVGKNSYWRVEGLCLQTAGIIHPVTHIHTPEDLKLNGCYLCQCSTRSEGKLHLLSIALIYATEYIFDLGTDAFKNENCRDAFTTSVSESRDIPSLSVSLFC